jgi:hypothetical protein
MNNAEKHETHATIARALDACLNGRPLNREGMALACASMKIDAHKVIATLVAVHVLEEHTDGGLYLGPLARGLLISAYLFVP